VACVSLNIGSFCPSDYRRKAYAELRVSISAWLKHDFAAELFVQGRGESRIEVTEQVKSVLLDLASYCDMDEMTVLRARVSHGAVVELARFLSHWQGQSELTGT
jgi:broad specificity phosphatase PhoE